MGAWGADVFENDDACDWAHDLAESEDGMAIIEETLSAVLETGDDYLEVDGGSQGLAACEVVARLKGQLPVRETYTVEVDGWVAANPYAPTAMLVERALAVIDRVLARPSELLDLWNDSADADAWHQSVAELRQRVAS